MLVMVPEPCRRAQLWSTFPEVTLGEWWQRGINQLGAGEGMSCSTLPHSPGLVLCSLPITCSFRSFADHMRVVFHQVTFGKEHMRMRVLLKKWKTCHSTCFHGKTLKCDLWVLDWLWTQGPACLSPRALILFSIVYKLCDSGGSDCLFPNATPDSTHDSSWENQSAFQSWFLCAGRTEDQEHHSHPAADGWSLQQGDVPARGSKLHTDAASLPARGKLSSKWKAVEEMGLNPPS